MISLENYCESFDDMCKRCLEIVCNQDGSLVSDPNVEVLKVVYITPKKDKTLEIGITVRSKKDIMGISELGREYTIISYLPFYAFEDRERWVETVIRRRL